MFALAAALWLAARSSPAAEPLTLAADGRSGYRIVIPAAAIPSERYAAEELQGYLEKISGARLPIVTDAEEPVEREIVLGDNWRLSVDGLKVAPAKLGPDGFVLRTAGQRVFIAGRRPRGTLYGVYELLEGKLGVRWFTPELEVVPRTNRVCLPSLDETFVPALQSRDVYWTEMTRNADFAARHHLNGQHYRLTQKHGGAATVYFPFVHSFDSLIPRQLYKEHPEYFPLINGQRKDGYVQRCLSNPDVVRLATARVREWIKQHPDATIISVSQNDTGEWCRCPECEALDQAEGTPSASLLRFVNAIAENLAPDYPALRIDTLAYQYTRKPPKTIRPRSNVIVRLCSIECCFGHPLGTCSSAEDGRYRADLAAWQPVAPTLYVWDYTPNFAHYEQPFPNFDVLQPNVRFFVAHGVTGLFEQGNYSPGGLGEMGPLRAYLLAELLWHPDADLERLKREFVEAYYGQAAPKILAYLDTIHRPVREGLHCHIYDTPKAAYLKPEIMDAAEKLLDEAEELAANDDVRFRVQVARLPVWYVKLATNRVKGEARAELLKRFLAIARKAGISNISESMSLADWAAKEQK